MRVMKKEPRCSGHCLHWRCGIRNVICNMPKLIRITTTPLSLKYLLFNQMRYMKENCFYILNMGRIVKDKGIDEVIRSFASVHAANSKLRLFVLGAFEDELDPISD